MSRARWAVVLGLGPLWGLGEACSVDPEEVEHCGGEVGFADGGGQAAAGEGVEDLLQVADGGFDGGAAAGVELGAFGGAESVVHRVAGAGVLGGRAGGGVVAGGLPDRAGGAGGDE